MPTLISLRELLLQNTSCEQVSRPDIETNQTTNDSSQSHLAMLSHALVTGNCRYLILIMGVWADKAN